MATQQPVFDLNATMEQMASNKKNPAFIADTRDLVHEGVRFANSALKTGTFAFNKYRAEEYEALPQKTLLMMASMLANGL